MGDPFEEKRLIEACLELLDKKLVVGIQDLGGAGLACATSETAGRGGVGMDVDVSAVPRREEGMEPWEVMTSESQERMLAIVTPDSWEAVATICAKWEVRAAVVGKVTAPDPAEGGRLRIRDGFDGPMLADVPAASLSDDAPLYDRPRQAPAAVAAAPVAPPDDCAADLLALLRSPRWVFRQYDHQLFLNTVVGPGGDAALLRLAGPGLPASERGVAVTTDSNPRACALDPRRGTALTLAEGVANLACVGATPVAVVNCLNFGNPEHPEVMWQLSECIDGMAEACRALSLPVIGGNVSLYNESGGADIDPTPVLGLLGLVEALHAPPPGLAWQEGDTLVLLGTPCRGRRVLPPGRVPLGHRAPPAPERDAARPRPGRPCGRVRLRGRAGQRHRRRRSRAAVAQRRARCVLGRPGRRPGRDGGGRRHRLCGRPGRRAPSCSPSCRRASWWPPPCPTSCAPGPRRLGIAAFVLGRAGGDRVALGDLVDLPLAALRQAHEGNLDRLLGDP